MSDDPINRPDHYTSHPSGVECITITEHFNNNKGNAIKYVWRAGFKGNELKDLKKARWYIEREIARLDDDIINKPLKCPKCKQHGTTASGEWQCGTEGCEWFPLCRIAECPDKSGGRQQLCAAHYKQWCREDPDINLGTDRWVARYNENAAQQLKDDRLDEVRRSARLPVRKCKDCGDPISGIEESDRCAACSPVCPACGVGTTIEKEGYRCPNPKCEEKWVVDD